MPRRVPEVEIEEDVHFSEVSDEDDLLIDDDFSTLDEDEDFEEVRENKDEDFWSGEY